jgi:SP family general alpha glucoside:H+ symporter-like MFS transporter
MDAEKTAITTHEESNKDLDSQLGHLVNAEDHEYGKWRAIRNNSWAFAVLGIPEFRKDFGSYVDNQYVINSTWQGAITGVPSAM